jgi:riboflavin kinase/FMN adenylyltransferase
LNYNKKTAVALGYFDGVHLGHAAVIKATTNTEFEPVVFTIGNRNSHNITTDSLKHKLLISLGAERICSYIFEEIRHFSPERFAAEILAETLNAKLVCCGYDFRFGEGGKADADKLKSLCGKLGAETIIIPPVSVNNTPVSSTLIRELIAKGDVKTANAFLGYELMYEQEVVGGNRLGRTIGFPTINQNLPPDCVLPRFGVYKSRTYIRGQALDSITNIGVKPTAGDNDSVFIETHIIGFDGDLYGEFVKVSLIDFIREEKKFNSFAELSAQIKQDLRTAHGK